MIMRFRSHRFATVKPVRPRRGFTLLEVIVAMTMLSVVLMSLAKLSTVISVRGRNADIVAKRSAVLQLETNKFGAMAFDSLRVFSTAAVTRTFGDFTFTRTLTITNVNSTRFTVKIVITPAVSSSLKDSATFDRTRPASSTPLCTNC